MLRYFAALCAAVCLAGCDNITAAFTSTPDRINAAFPLPAELQTASARLLASLDADKAARQLEVDQLHKLMKVRALTCTAATPVGRFDSKAQILRKVIDLACFKQQDAQIGDRIGMRRIGLALREAPAYPAAPLPPQQAPLPNYVENMNGIVVAADANVMVVQGPQSFAAAQLPGGKQFSSFAVAQNGGRLASLSPNGRLLAVPVAKGLRIVEVGSGNAVWSTDKYTEFVAWLPKLDLVVLTEARTGTPHVLDARRGTVEPYPSAEKTLSWGLGLDGDKLLVGTNTSVSLMRHSRSADGTLDIAPVKNWTLPGHNPNRAPLLLSQGRKLVYARGNDVAWLNLETGDKGTWPLSTHISPLAKISDTAIFFQIAAPGGGPRVGRVIDVDKLTIASVTDVQGSEGALYSLAPRMGYFKRSSEAAFIGGSVDSENPQDLERMIAEAQLAQQLAKLEAEKPLLTGVPDNAKLSVIGVYEPEGAVHSHRSERVAVPIRVNVGPGSTPLVLALCSYEPVKWTLNTNGRKIHTILLSSYYESSVVGQGGTQVLKIGRKCAYKIDGPEYAEWKKEIARYVSAPVQIFQGGYKGREFTVQ